MEASSTQRRDSVDEESRLLAEHEMLRKVLVYKQTQLGKSQEGSGRMPKMAVGLIKSAKMAYLTWTHDAIYDHLQTTATDMESASIQHSGDEWTTLCPKEDVFARAFGAALDQAQRQPSSIVVVEREINELEERDLDTDQARSGQPMLFFGHTSINHENIIIEGENIQMASENVPSKSLEQAWTRSGMSIASSTQHDEHNKQRMSMTTFRQRCQSMLRNVRP
jgi:hypothetical protein